MSIVDPAKSILNPILWTIDGRLLPAPRKYFMDLLQQIFPLNKIHTAIMLGSNVGYQYSDSSDIDINIMGVQGESYEAWHKIFKEFNDKNHLLPGTQHPINFFFQEFTGPFDPAKWRTSLGAYDLIHDEWVQKPIPYVHLQEPEKKFEREIQFASMMNDEIESMINGLHRAIVNEDHDVVIEKIRELKILFNQINENRKTAYMYGIGTPALQEYNIIYKLIEHGPYHDLFKYLIG